MDELLDTTGTELGLNVTVMRPDKDEPELMWGLIPVPEVVVVPVGEIMIESGDKSVLFSFESANNEPSMLYVTWTPFLTSFE